MKRQDIETAIRSLGLCATKKGYDPLIDLVEQLLSGIPYSPDLLRETAARYSITVTALHGHLKSLLPSIRKYEPERWRELFGDGPVSTPRLVRAVAEYTARQV